MLDYIFVLLLAGGSLLFLVFGAHITTVLALKAGSSEANPVARMLFRHIGINGLLAFKLVLWCLAALAWIVSPDSVATPFNMTLFYGFLFLVGFHETLANYKVLQRQLADKHINKRLTTH